MTEQSRSFHERLDALLGTHTRLFLDKFRALYAAGDLSKILGLQVEKTPLQHSESSHLDQAHSLATQAEPVAADGQVAELKQTLPSTESTHTAEQPATRGGAIAEYLRTLRQTFATSRPLFSMQLSQSAQTA